jgi:hypothetical protein
LQSQPHNLSAASIEDVSALLAPYEGHLDEMRYEGFLNLVLPKDPSHLWLKDTILARASRSSWPSRVNEDHMSPDVAYRLCQLFESEMDVSRHLKFHRKNIMELGVMLQSICKFLDREQGVCAGMGGLLSPNSLRRILVDDLQVMTSSQCDALLQRINPSRSCLAPFHELAKVLGLSSSITFATTSSWRTSKSDYKDVLGASFESFGKSGDDVLGLSSSRISHSVSPLKEPAVPFTLPEAAPVASIGVDTNGDGKVDTYITGPDRNRIGIPDVLKRKGSLASIGLDTTGDGKIDTYMTGADQRQDTSWLPSPTRLLYDEEPQSNFKDVRSDTLCQT